MCALRQLRFFYITFFGITILLFSSCTFLRQTHKDSFYSDVGGLDSLRIPLIKPYYMIYLDEEFSWQMPLLANPPTESTYYYFNLHNIKKLSVKNGVIMVYTPYVEHNIDISIGQKIFHWFVILPASNTEEGFENEADFLEYIQQLGVQQPNWIDPNETSKGFVQTGCLDWIPDCE